MKIVSIEENKEVDILLLLIIITETCMNSDSKLRDSFTRLICFVDIILYFFVFFTKEKFHNSYMYFKALAKRK